MNYCKVYTSLFVVFFFILSGCDGREKNRPVDISDIQEKSLPDYVLEDVTHYHYENGILKLEITFEKGKFYSAEDELYVENCTFIYYDINENLLSRGRSKKAKVFSDQSLIIAENEVVIVSEVNGGVLETEYLEWHGQGDQFLTDSPVTITRKNGDIITGIGMVADIALRFVTIQKDVKGSFRNSVG